MGGAAIDLVGEQLGLPPEATAILGMVGKGKPFTKSVKDKAKELNRQKYGGKLVSEKSGDELVRGQRHQKGVRPPDNEAHVDHKIPRAQGGDNSLENAQILSRKENLQKGSKCEKP
jgi:5-methylcytosine-specific restriction endonuclease McrA